jgi:hypothetical protein
VDDKEGEVVLAVRRKFVGECYSEGVKDSCRDERLANVFRVGDALMTWMIALVALVGTAIQLVLRYTSNSQ